MTNIDIYHAAKRYKVIYADPPWEYVQSGSKTNVRGMAKQHYKTMATDEIKELPIPKESEAMCFLWATLPNIDQALEVLKAWGFVYKTAAFVWVKCNRKSGTPFWGMGAYTRANAEVCLLGITPGLKAKEWVKSHRVHQIISAPIGRHSEKPEETRNRIVQLVGDIPRIELFARQKVQGWDCWGDEV